MNTYVCGHLGNEDDDDDDDNGGNGMIVINSYTHREPGKTRTKIREPPCILIVWILFSPISFFFISIFSFYSSASDTRMEEWIQLAMHYALSSL